MNLYKIIVSTSEIKYAGTDANVFVQLDGTYSTTEKLPLKKSLTNKKPFQTGQNDLFEIKCENVGNLKKIRIGHDAKGIGSGWHLKKVTVESVKDQVTWTCECNRWLDTFEDDGKLERELNAIIEPKKPLETNQPETIYNIYVTTSDLELSGTDANVYIYIHGRSGLKAGKIYLKSSKMNMNMFERGKTDFFEIREIDVGEIEMIRIGHDNSGLGPGWHLKEVVVEVPACKRRYKFSCNRWLDKNSDDGKIERDLIADGLVRKDVSVESWENLVGKKVNYAIVVRTSDILNAGTDANVHLKVYGSLDKSDWMGLDRSETHRNKFERGNLDRFMIREKFFGNLDKIRIRHDGKGVAAGWHLQEVVIECEEVNRKWVFSCNRWLDKNEGDGRIEVELKPVESELEMLERTEYLVEVLTGDERLAGTDSEVYLTIIGELGESSEKHLSKSETNFNKFERNKMDVFRIVDRNFGRLYGLKVRHDNSLSLSDWFLDRIVVTDQLKKKVYTFVCKKWFSLKKDDRRIERVIREMSYKGLNRHEDVVKKKSKRIESKINVVKFPRQYYVKFYTGAKQLLTGTDMNVYIKIFGDWAQSDELRLVQNKTHHKNFERNQIDLFVVNADQELGTIYAILLKFENCLKTSNDLHISKVQVYSNDYLYEFDYDLLISVRNSDKRFQKVILLEKNASF